MRSLIRFVLVLLVLPQVPLLRIRGEDDQGPSLLNFCFQKRQSQRQAVISWMAPLTMPRLSDFSRNTALVRVRRHFSFGTAVGYQVQSSVMS